MIHNVLKQSILLTPKQTKKKIKTQEKNPKQTNEKKSIILINIITRPLIRSLDMHPLLSKEAEKG